MINIKLHLTFARRSPLIGVLFRLDQRTLAVKIAKYQFDRAVAPSALDSHELRNLVCHILALVNSGQLVFKITISI